MRTLGAYSGLVVYVTAPDLSSSEREAIADTLVAHLQHERSLDAAARHAFAEALDSRYGDLHRAASETHPPREEGETR